MGLFDLFKSNKNIITDNGTNYIYYDDGKGSIKEKFSKINGVLNGDYIEYNRNGTFISKTYKNGVIPLTEEEIYLKNRQEEINNNIKVEISKLKIIDDLISEISGIFLLVQMENSKIDYYSALIEEKYSYKFDEDYIKFYQDYIKFYLYTKRNYFIKHLIEYNRVQKMEIGESFDEIKVVNYYNERFTEHVIKYSDNTFNCINYNFIRENIKSNPTPSNIVNKYILEKLFVNFDVNCELRFDDNGIGINKEIFNQESILFGLNFNTYKLIYEIIKKKSSREFLRDIQDKDNIGMWGNLSEIAQKVVNEILSLCNNSRVNQEGIVIEIKKKSSKAFFQLIEDRLTKTSIELFESGTNKDIFGDYQGAINDFTSAIEIDGEYIDAFRYRAMAKSNLYDHDGAINDYSKIIEINSEDVHAFVGRAHSYALLKKYELAIEDFDKVIEIDQESKKFSSRGRMKKYLLDFDGALRDYNIAVEKYPDDDSSIFGRGELKYEIADYHGAIKDFNKCIELKPNRIMSFHKRGDCKLKIEDYKGAIEDYSKVIQNRQDKYGVDGPSSENAAKILASLYHNRGFARRKIKEYSEAIEDLKKAIELDPDNEQAIQLLESLK
jgi:tetratricopeptide (TPR) repeat protein